MKGETTPLFDQTRDETLIDPFHSNAVAKRIAYPILNPMTKRKGSKK